MSPMKQLLYIGNNLKQPNANVSVMATLGPLLASEGYELRYASSKPNQWLRLWDMVRTLISSRHQVDLVLIDTYSSLNFYYALIISQLARIFGIPYIPILHGGLLPSRLKQSPWFSRLVFAHAKVNVAPSLFMKSAFEAEGYQNIHYIPNTIALDHYPLFKKTYTAPNLLWVRSFASLYHPEMALQVLKSLKELGYQASLCMVGPDKDGTLQEVKDLAKQWALDVVFTGKLSKAEWIKISKDYNFFINTTTVDNMPVSVVEAMALGFPVVSTNVGGMPSLITTGKNGVLVASGDAEAMVNAIVNLLQDSAALTRLSVEARASASEFDWTKVKQLWFDVIERNNCLSSI